MRNWVKKRYRSILENSDLWLCFVLAGFGLFVMQRQFSTLDAAAVATLAGALFGGAAVLLGNWINRYNQRHGASEDLEQRRAIIKTLIAAELVNVAAGLIGAKYVMDAALTTWNVGGLVHSQPDLSREMPRNMPFTDGLGAELLILEQPAIDALATLRSNLSITRLQMEAVTAGREHFGLLKITALANGLAHDMSVLADAFAHIAPARQLALADQAAELATTVLRRMAATRATTPA
jgi:hypothetical protein